MAEGKSKSSYGNTGKRIRSMGWCFTSFSEKIIFDETKVQYLIYGNEICPTTGRKHKQGFIYFKNPTGLTGVKKVVGSTAHCEIRSKNSTNSQAINYCKKDGDFVEYGKAPNDNGVTNLKKKLDECGSLINFVNEETELYCKYRNGIIDYYKMNTEPFSGEREVIWIYGPSGIGKSRLARMICSDNFVNHCNGFWDYLGEEEVIYDDFRASDMKLNELLKITDRYKVRVNVKGNNVPWMVKKIVFTSILPPWVMYKDMGENMKQIKRRLSLVINLEIASEIKCSKRRDVPLALHTLP